MNKENNTTDKNKGNGSEMNPIEKHIGESIANYNWSIKLKITLNWETFFKLY